MKHYAILLSLFVAVSAHAGKCGCSGKPSKSPAPAPAPVSAPAPAPTPAPSPSVSSGGTWKPWNDQQWLTVQGKLKAPADDTQEDKLVPPVVAEKELPPENPTQRIEEKASLYIITVPMPYPVEKIVEVESVKLELIQTATVFFKTNSTKLTDDGKLTLAAMAVRANRTKNAQIAVATGHASTTGTKSRNAILAEGRAKAAVDYLVGIGFPKDQIKFEHYGDDNPEFEAKTKADHLLNQRVDLILRGLR